MYDCQKLASVKCSEVALCSQSFTVVVCCIRLIRRLASSHHIDRYVDSYHVCVCVGQCAARCAGTQNCKKTYITWQQVSIPHILYSYQLETKANQYAKRVLIPHSILFQVLAADRKINIQTPIPLPQANCASDHRHTCSDLRHRRDEPISAGRMSQKKTTG